MRLEYFILIDRIAELSLAERTIRTDATVPTRSTIFEGHFPGYPLMPGVLLTEMMAQTSAWLTIAVTRFTRMPILASVQEAKMRAAVLPGDVLSVTAKLIHEGSGFARTEAEIRRDGKLVSNATLTLRLIEFPNEAPRAAMEKLAADLAFPMDALAHG